MSNCDNCKLGTRNYALDSKGNPIPRLWGKGVVALADLPKVPDPSQYWIYVDCTKMFGLPKKAFYDGFTDEGRNCPFFQKKT